MARRASRAAISRASGHGVIGESSYTPRHGAERLTNRARVPARAAVRGRHTGLVESGGYGGQALALPPQPSRSVLQGAAPSLVMKGPRLESGRRLLQNQAKNPAQAEEAVSRYFVMGREGFEPSTLGLREPSRDLGLSRPVWDLQGNRAVGIPRISACLGLSRCHFAVTLTPRARSRVVFRGCPLARCPRSGPRRTAVRIGSRSAGASIRPTSARLPLGGATVLELLVHVLAPFRTADPPRSGKIVGAA